MKIVFEAQEQGELFKIPNYKDKYALLKATKAIVHTLQSIIFGSLIISI